MTSITFKTNDGKEYHLETDHLNPNLLSAGSPGRIKKIANYLDDVETQEGERGMTIVHGNYKNIPISAFPTGMGPASAAIIVPEAIEAAEGPLTLLRLGTAGALQSYVEAGDIVVSTGSIRDESTTESVVGSEYPSIADPELVPVMIGVAEEFGYDLGDNLWTGIGHVKDDLYFKETPHLSPSKENNESKLNSYRRMGALSSSMEFSVYTILRDFYEGKSKNSILVGALLAIIAEAEEDESVKVEKETKTKLEKDLIKIGLRVLKATHNLREGKEINLNFEKIIRKMIQSPTRFESKNQ